MVPKPKTVEAIMGDQTEMLLYIVISRYVSGDGEREGRGLHSPSSPSRTIQ